MARRCWSFLLVLWPYTALLLADMQVQFDIFDSMNGPWQIWMVCGVALCLMNIICALRWKAHAARIGLTAKLLLLPIYVLFFFCGAILFAMSPPAVIILFLLDGMLLLATSAYTLRGLYQAWRGGRMPTGWAIALALSQCMFVLDVLGSIALYVHEKRRSC